MMEMPLINLPPPYSTDVAAVPGRTQTHQATTITNSSDTAAMLSRVTSNLQPNTTINVTDSTDIVIGPMTQFNDRVTIYQYAPMNHRREPENDSLSQQKTLNWKLAFNVRRNWLNMLAVCATILGISTTIYFIFYTNNAATSPPPIVFGRNYDSDTFPNLGGHHYVINRETWGALNHSKLLDMTRLRHPINYVVVGHMGVQAEPCFNIYTCSVKMRSIQDNSIGNKGLLDVSANFYLGGDGNIYTGRGWDYENSYGTMNLAVLFLGDFMRYDVEEKQFEAFQYLLNYGRTENYLSVDYRLFGLNQTTLSKYSPGVNVVKRIKKLKRFSMCGEVGNMACGKDIGIEWNKGL